MERLIIDENCSTNIKGVFAGGDAVNGGKEVVDAVQAGKDGAKAIIEISWNDSSQHSRFLSCRRKRQQNIESDF